MFSSNYQVVFQGLDTLHIVYIGYFDSDWWESSELVENKVTAQKKRGKAFVGMGDDILEVHERETIEYAYYLMRNGWKVYLFNPVNKNNNRFEADFSSATIQPTDKGKPDLKVASRKEVAYGNL